MISEALQTLGNNINQSLLRVKELQNDLASKVESIDEVKHNLSKVWFNNDKVHFEICKELSWLASTQMELRTLKKLLVKSDEVPAVKEQLKRLIDNRIKDIEDLKESYNYLKMGYEARIRFYNSSQFLT